MLGWYISVYRRQGNRLDPANYSDERGARVAVWQTGLDGLDWIEDVAHTKGHCLGGNGYPCRYTPRAHDLLPAILSGPRNPWHSDPGDILGLKWVGRTLIVHEVKKACDLDEWRFVEAWGWN